MTLPEAGIVLASDPGEAAAEIEAGLLASLDALSGIDFELPIVRHPRT